jgi:O-glycosyl hydrolase
MIFVLGVLRILNWRLLLAFVSLSLLAVANNVGGQTVVFQADFQNSVAEAQTSLTNLDAGTEVGAWSSTNAANLNIYSDASGAEKAFCPDGGYFINATFSSPVALASSVTIHFLLARGRYNSPGTGKAFTITGYDGNGTASFDLKVFANENQAAGTNGAVYWNSSSSGYTNWMGTNFSAAGDVRQISVASNNYNPSEMSALQVQLFSSGYVVSLDSKNDGSYEWVSNLLPYRGGPSTISQIDIVGGPGAGDWFDDFFVTGTATTATNNVFISIQPESPKQLITGWGYDIKGVSGYTVTPAYAQTLFVTDRMGVLRLPIWGDAANPAHPSPGVVVASYYADSLYAMTNARAANSNVLFFASKKLDGQNSFPSWTKNSNGVVASQYAIMLADYLQFMATNGFAIDVLGIDNERQYNEGNITPSVYNDVINALRPMAVSRGFPLPARFIGPENYSPDTSWLTTLINDGWGTNLDIVGTHYYPSDRPYTKLQQLVATGGSRPDWHSEVHWDNSFGDVIDNAEAALATVFDCTDNNFSAFVWWQYTRSGVQGGIEEAFSISMAQSSAVPTLDQNGATRSLGQMISRTFRGQTNLAIWVLNNTTNAYTNCNVYINQGSFVGEATFNQWTVSGETSGTVNTASSTNFFLNLSPQTVSEILIGYQSPSNFPPVLLSPALNNGAFQIQVSSGGGSSFTLLGSADLTNWTPLLTTNTATLPFFFNVPLTNGSPRYFYRVRAKP